MNYSPENNFRADYENKKPEPSLKLSLTLERLDEILAESENDLKSVDELLRDEYFVNNKEKEEIYKKREEIVLSPSDIDEDAFREMGRLKRLLYFFAPRDVREKIKPRSDEEGFFVHTGKLKREVEDVKFIVDDMAELRQLAKQCGLDINTAQKLEFTKTYKYIDDKVVKIVRRNRTEEEQAHIARDFYNKELAEFEKRVGDKLIIAKREFIAYKRAQKQSLRALDLLSDHSKREELKEKILSEEAEKIALIEEMEQEAEVERKERSEFFQIRLTAVRATEDMAMKIELGLKNTEKKYHQRIKDISVMIKKLGRLAGENAIDKEIIDNLTEELAQTEANVVAIKERLTDINNRLKVIRINIREYEKIIKRINSVGKTALEMQAEDRQKTKPQQDKSAINLGLKKQAQAIKGEIWEKRRPGSKSQEQETTGISRIPAESNNDDEGEVDYESYETKFGVKIFEKRKINKKELAAAKETAESEILKLPAGEWLKMITIKDKQQRSFKKIIREKRGKYRSNEIFSETEIRELIAIYAEKVLKKNKKEATEFAVSKIKNIKFKKLKK